MKNEPNFEAYPYNEYLFVARERAVCECNTTEWITDRIRIS